MEKRINSADGVLHEERVPFYCSFKVKSAVFAAMVFFGTVLLLLYEVPTRDAAFRYVPMAAAFAEGDFALAFHPRSQFFHPLLSGMGAFFTGDAFIGAKAASFLCFILTVFPLYALMKEAFSEKQAVLTSGLYLISPYLMRLGISGLRDSAKSLAIVLTVYGLVMIMKYRKKLSGYLWLGIGCGAAFGIRNEMILYVLPLLAAAGILEFRSCGRYYRAAAAAGVTFLCALPEFIINFALCGKFVPGVRFISLFENAFRMEASPQNVLLLLIPGSAILFAAAVPVLSWLLKKKWLCAGIAAAAVTAGIVSLIRDPGNIVISWYSVSRYIIEILKGCDRYMVPLFIIGIVVLIRERRWSALHGAVAGLFLWHTLAVAGQILFHDRKLYIEERYLVTAAPVLFGFAVCGLQYIWRIGNRYSPHLTVLLFISAVSFCLFYSTWPVWKDKVNRGRIDRLRTIRSAAAVMRQDYKGEKFRRPVFDPFNYKSGRAPEIWFNDDSSFILTAYFADGFFADSREKADYVFLRKGKGNIYVPPQFRRILYEDKNCTVLAKLKGGK